MVSSVEVWGKANPRPICTSRCYHPATQLCNHWLRAEKWQPWATFCPPVSSNDQQDIVPSSWLQVLTGCRVLWVLHHKMQKSILGFAGSRGVFFWWYFEPCLLKRGMWDCALSYWCLVKLWMHNGRGGLSILAVHCYCYLLYCASGYGVPALTSMARWP